MIQKVRNGEELNEVSLKIFLLKKKINGRGKK